MTQAHTTVTMIRPQAPVLNAAPNPFQVLVENCGRKLLAYAPQMPNVRGEPDKGDAQDLTRGLLDFAKIVDDTLLDIGREARARFGRGIELACFTDTLRDAIEGFATHTICAAVEEREDDFGNDIDPDYRYKSRRDAA